MEVEEKGSSFNGRIGLLCFTGFTYEGVDGFCEFRRIILLNSLKIELGMVTRLATESRN